MSVQPGGDHMIHRRKFLTGVLGLVTAPAIVHIANIMPVSTRMYSLEDHIRRELENYWVRRALPILNYPLSTTLKAMGTS